MEQARTPPVSGALSEAQQKQRLSLLAAGEAALARTDVAAALAAFEQAAGIQHAADTEMGLVRTYMQGGEYRRALAFVAHTANAHREVPGGAALYAWLLHAGGQHAAAQRLLDEADARFNGDSLLVRVRGALASAMPLATGPLLVAPSRLAPFDAPGAVAVGARVVATGVLTGDGAHALVALPAAGPTLWVRNGLGRVSRARVEQRFDAAGLARLRLAQPIALPADSLSLAARDAFPGSVAHAVSYVPSRDATPRWPLLAAGFTGAPLDDGRARALTIDTPRDALGTVVFDAWGRLAGLEVAGLPRRSITVSRMREVAGELWRRASTTAAAPSSADAIYESALHSVVHVLSSPFEGEARRGMGQVTR